MWGYYSGFVDVEGITECGGVLLDSGCGDISVLDRLEVFFFGSCGPIGAGRMYWCRPIGADWETGTYCQLPTGTNSVFCTSAFSLFDWPK